MLNVINTALETLLRERGQLDPIDIDVRFDLPSDDWVSSLTRPTVNMFLFELHENTEKRDSAPQTTVTNGKAERRMPPRRIDLQYMVSVLTADIQDENELLWRVMATLMKYPQFVPELLPDPLRAIAPPMVARVASRDESRNMLDIWSSVGTEPHPSLCYIVTAPMDLALTFDSPLVLTRTARYRSLASVGNPSRVGVQIGGTVRSRGGQPVADVLVRPQGSALGSVTAADGRFVLRGVPEGQLRLTVVRDGHPQTVEVQVPAESYDIVLDG
jgi:hypothetical protein